MNPGQTSEWQQVTAARSLRDNEKQHLSRKFKCDTNADDADADDDGEEEEEEEEEEDDDDRLSSCSTHKDNSSMSCDEFGNFIGEEDEFVYTQLDTIVEVEEDEEQGGTASEMTSGQSRAEAAVCDSRLDEQTMKQQPLVARLRLHDPPLINSSSSLRPQAADQQRQQYGSASKVNGSERVNENLESENKCDTPLALARRNNKMQQSLQVPIQTTTSQQQQQMSQPLGATLPSTNRLISEHQARQQQALFRALAERQKLADKRGAGQARLTDLMAGRPLYTRNSTRDDTRSHRRRRNHRRDSAHNEKRGATKDVGVPLSAVDLSSMSDGMLDELLGHIASASSSSLSSNADSLDSSDLSAPDFDDQSTDEEGGVSAFNRSAREKSGSGLALQVDASPNVIGVHEDIVGATAVVAASQQQRANCRGDRKSTSEDDEDANDDDEPPSARAVELKMNDAPSASASSSIENSLSPRPLPEQHAASPASLELSAASDCRPSVASSTLNSSSKLERYFTSGLVEPHHFHSSSDELSGMGGSGTPLEQDQEPTGRVEEVLVRMLNALERIDDTEPAEQLNGLLERGFAHLERLLNCSLAPANEQNNLPANENGSNRLANIAAGGRMQQQKLLISTTGNSSQQTLLSKDSDYGSDTQSADCLSQFTDGVSVTAGAEQAALSGRWLPSSSVNGSSTQRRSSRDESLSPSSSNEARTLNGQQQPLSALAIELSFKLAESLHRLAQQQAARRSEQEGEREQELDEQEVELVISDAKTKRKSSVVLLNAIQNNQSPIADWSQNSSLSFSAQSACSSPQQATTISASNLTPTTTDSSSVLNETSALQRHQRLDLTTSKTSNKRPQFKTRVNLGTGEVSNVIVASSGERTSVFVQQPQVVEVPASEEKPEEVTQHQQVSCSSGSQVIRVGVQQPAALLERHRSARNSLRRRGSLGAPRPGSPLPRGILEVSQSQPQPQPQSQAQAQAQDSVISMQQDKQQEQQIAEGNERQQKQLQRALVLAQKYNYSPAKLAASKLSAKLQLKDLYTEESAHFKGSTTSVKQATQEPNGCLQEERHGLRHHSSSRQAISVTGQIQLDISYFARSGSLTVHVMQCSQLAPVSKRRTTSNPYVKLYLLPDKTKSGKRKSSIQRNQLSPKFDEKFTFGPVQFAEFEFKILWLSVWHKDRLGRNEFLGELLLPLAQVGKQLLTSDLCQSTGPKWHQLNDRQHSAPTFFYRSRSGETHFYISLSKRKHKNSHTNLWHQPLDASLSFSNGSGSGNGKQQLAAKQELLCYNYQINPTGAPSSGDKNNILSSPAKNKIKHTTRELEQQAELVNQLGELQLKAARLTSAVAPSSYPVSAHSGMNVSLGSLASKQVGVNQATVTGQLFVALKFVPEGNEQLKATSPRALASAEGELHVMIKEAHNIGGFVAAPQVAPPSGSLPNPFCKCYLLGSSGQRLAKQKTNHLKRTVNPRWDHKCIFNSVKLTQLASQAVEVHMFNRDSILVSNEYLGGIRLCRAASAQQQQTLTSNEQQVGDSSSIASSEQSADGGNNSLRRSFSRQDSSASKPEDEDSLCSERESRLWNQMLAKPNIWVYGELKLKHLRPLLPNSNHH